MSTQTFRQRDGIAAYVAMYAALANIGLQS